MTIYTVETGDHSGGSLTFATSDKLEAYRLAKQMFYSLILDRQDFNLWSGRGRNVKTEAVFYESLLGRKVIVWKAGGEWVSLKIWK